MSVEAQPMPEIREHQHRWGPPLVATSATAYGIFRFCQAYSCLAKWQHRIERVPQGRHEYLVVPDEVQPI